MQIAYQHANDPVPAPSAKNPAVPAELDDLVLWATAKNPDQRPKDAREMLDRLVEAEKAIRGESTGFQPTMVLAPAYGPETATGDTQIINPAIRQQVAASTPSTVDALTASASRRRAKGWWLFALVILLAALAGGTGWYFGSGPGSLVLVPNVAGKTPTAATAQLKDLGFQTALGQEYSTTIQQGLVANTDPEPGHSITRGSTVTIKVSQGPRPITVPALAGHPVDEAKNLITQSGAVVGDIAQQFDAKAPAGVVLAAGRATDGSDISGGGPYLEGSKVNLAVSAGPVPDVSGQSVDAAKAALQKVGLLTAPGPENYSDTVDKGNVIAAQPQHEGPVRPGDTLLLETSKGPEPVAVPDVVGKTWEVAKKTLTDAGFTLKYSPIADVAPPAFVVSKISPAAGTLQPKGSTITVNFAGF